MKTGLTIVAGLIALATHTLGADNMHTNVQREADKVWIPGAKGWFVGDKESSIHAAQEAAMQAVGEAVSYDDLLGVSGLAFRMQIFKNGFCPSSPHGNCGFPCGERSSDWLPWATTSSGAKPEETNKVAEIRQAVVDSINRGVPVQYGREEDGLIVGYQKNGAEWICLHPYRAGGKTTFTETKWPWGITVFTAPKTHAVPRHALVRDALKQAVAMARAGESGGYFVGFKAWDNYLESLKKLDGADEKARKDAMQGNAWIYECLAQYRASAARFLRANTAGFSPEQVRHLTRAADCYDKLANQVLRDETHCVVTIAPYPFTLKKGESWTDDARHDQIRRLEAALPLEREAIAELEAALAAND